MPPDEVGPAPTRTPGAIATPPGAYCPFFISPVISIRDPSCSLISDRICFGPLMRRCMPSGIGAPDGSSSVRAPAVNTRPFEHPGTNTRTESFGTGFFSCAPSAPLTITATIAAPNRMRVLICLPCARRPSFRHMLHDLAALHDEDDAAHRGDVVQWVAGDRHEVGVESGGYGPDPLPEREAVGGHRCRANDRIHRRFVRVAHPIDELLRVPAVC